MNALQSIDRLRVLLLEDNPADAELAELRLARAGMVFEARRVERREEFVAALQEFKPDLVLADYSLPDMDGLDALRIVRERLPHLPYIIVCGVLDEERAVEMLQQGANDYLLKDRLHRLPEAISRSIEETRRQIELDGAKKSLEASEARFRALVETSSDWIWEIDVRGFYKYCSPSVSTILGYSPEELVGRPVLEFMTPDERTRLAPLLEKILAERKPFFMLEWTSRHQDGKTVFLESSGAPAFDSAGTVSGFRGTTRNITARRVLESEDRDRAEQLRILFEHNADGIVVVDRNGEIAAINPTAAKFFGRTADAMIGMSFGVPVVVGQSTQIVLNNLVGDEIDASMCCAKIPWKGDTAYLVSLQDFTEHKKHLQDLDLAAHHDNLTGLPNRLLLADRMRQAVAHHRRAKKRIAVCYLDLDGFKEINDALGHEAGDAVLVEVAERLQSLMRGGDTVARLGGDEFVMLLGDLKDTQECENALERLATIISKPYKIGGHEYSGISASIGVTIFPDDNADPDSLMRHADHAMYSAKQAGKNRYVFFDAPMEHGIEARIDTIKRVERALHDGQLVLHYQPKFDFRNGELSGVEALIRWQHPVLGLVPPSEFLPVIEDTTQANDIGHWVIEEALRQLSAWKTQGFKCSVSVNASARQLVESGFAAKLQDALGRHAGIADGDLQIELVETGALKDFHRVKAVITECLEFGVRFSLDDFGTGYSTLEYLRHLPANEIKIDQSFVLNMLEDKDDETIVKAVIGLGDTFQLDVVAEGAETVAHIERLYDLGCHVIQGYAIARPMPAEEVIDWLKRYESDFRSVIGDARMSRSGMESEV